MPSIVHIGFHKTGSTSIQSFLWTHRDRISAHGVEIYEGQHLCSNHVELHTAALRPERITPFKLSSGISGGPYYRAGVEARIADFYTKLSRTALFTAEGLSYLRWPDELSWLSSVLRTPVTIVAYLRRLPDYKAAYRYTLDAHNMPPSVDPHSVAYQTDNSWLWDYDARLRPFRDTFGDENVIVLDYDAETSRDGSVIPSLLRVFGIEDIFTTEEWANFRLSQRPTRH